MNFIVGRENSKEGKDLKRNLSPADWSLKGQATTNESSALYAAEKNLPGRFTKGAPISELPKKPEAQEEEVVPVSKPLIPENFDYEKLQKVTDLLKSIERLNDEDKKEKKFEHQPTLLKIATIMLKELDLLEHNESLDAEGVPEILKDLAA